VRKRRARRLWRREIEDSAADSCADSHGPSHADSHAQARWFEERLARSAEFRDAQLPKTLANHLPNSLLAEISCGKEAGKLAER
jgi:hypothetical protein